MYRSSPLIVATDLRNLSAQKRSIVANPEVRSRSLLACTFTSLTFLGRGTRLQVIAIDQDPLWTAGERIANFTSKGLPGQVWCAA